MKIDARFIFRSSVIVLVLALGACSSGSPTLPYPAFIVVDELPNAFMANLPGVRAKRLAGDPETRQFSSRIVIPPDWQFTTGASPGQSVEIFVLAGRLTVGEFELTTGGYAWLPPGSSGSQLKSEGGAVILYFVDNASDTAVIQTPLITNAELLDWAPLSPGFWSRTLRTDPGSGSSTWLLRVEPAARTRWQRSAASLEGYLLSGDMTASECVAGKVVTATYAPGGYFVRPPGAIHGGPAERTASGAVWFLRASSEATMEMLEACNATP
jgi:quercetin dioxygenase-like cupin family protein